MAKKSEKKTSAPGSIVPCVFCRSTERKLSNEHLFSAWLEEEFPDLQPGLTAEMQSRENPRPGQPAIETRQLGRPFTQTVRAVCRDCNHGWMSELERGVRPVLSKLIHGQPTHLSRPAMKALAVWVEKTLMMFEFTQKDPRVIPDTHLHWLHDHREPPPGCQMWIGSYRGQDWTARLRHVHGRDALLEPLQLGIAGAKVHATTVVLGQAVMFCCGTTRPELIDLSFVEGRFRDSLHRIWPDAAPFGWPGRVAFNDQTIAHLSDALRMEYPGIPSSQFLAEVDAFLGNDEVR